jgi:hypothetical protein
MRFFKRLDQHVRAERQVRGDLLERRVLQLRQPPAPRISHVHEREFFPQDNRTSRRCRRSAAQVRYGRPTLGSDKRLSNLIIAELRSLSLFGLLPHREISIATHRLNP